MRWLSVRFYLYFCLTMLLCNAVLAEDKIFLSSPDCYPHCSSEDQARLLLNGETEKIVLDAIAAAQSEIRFSIYTFSRWPIFRALLAATSERGVKLRGLVDRAQLANLAPYCQNDRCDLSNLIPNQTWENLSVVQRLQIFEPLPLFRNASLAGKLLLLSYKNEQQIAIRVGSGQSRLMHNKFLIIDDQILQTSSGNWSSTAMSVNFENTIELRAPVAKEVIDAHICAFEAIWNQSANSVGQKLAICNLPEKIYFTPTSGSFDTIEKRIMAAIKAATVSIDISMHHLAHPDVIAALSEATLRGVALRILFDDDDCPIRTPDLLRNLISSSLGRAQVRYLPTQCKINQLSHNRFGIFDGKLLINGSANWSKAGLKSNYESFQVFDDPSTIAQFASHFQTLFKQSLDKATCRCSLRQVECRERYCRGEFSPQFPRPAAN